MHKIKIQQFEGPLDLLLHLIEQQELDITEISLATVTDQYILMLKSAEQVRPDDLADFLVVAAKLLLIKSKTLLPQLAVAEDDDGIELERQLKLYKAFLEASRGIQQMINSKHFRYSREGVTTIEPVFYPPRSLTAKTMADVLRLVIENVEPFVVPPPDAIHRTINIQEKIDRIKNEIFEKSFMSFSTLLKDSKSKMDAIVTFLALLELVKQRTVAVVQKSRFEDIEIQKQPDHIPV